MSWIHLIFYLEYSRNTDPHLSCRSRENDAVFERINEKSDRERFNHVSSIQCPPCLQASSANIFFENSGEENVSDFRDLVQKG